MKVAEHEVIANGLGNGLARNRATNAVNGLAGEPSRRSSVEPSIEPANGLAGGREGARLKPIVRTSLHDEVVEHLRALIVEGYLQPESRVPEVELCEQMGVSRTPIREALKVLAAEGLVTLVPRRGAIVTGLEPALIDQLFDVLESLEPLAGELACKHMPQAIIGEIRRWHDEMIAHYDSGEREAYFRLNRRIHEAIVKECGNPFLANTYEGLGARVRYTRYMANFSEVSWRQAVEEHSEMMNALEARDGPALAQILKRHLRHKREYLKHALS